MYKRQGNEARAHFGDEVKRSVRFFEQEYSLVLNLCLPSGKWITVSPSEARAVIKHRRQLEEKSFHHTLAQSSFGSPSFSANAMEKAWLSPLPCTPLSGSNAVPLSSTPRGEKRRKTNPGPLPDEDVTIDESCTSDRAEAVSGGGGEKEKEKEKEKNTNSNL